LDKDPGKQYIFRKKLHGKGVFAAELFAFWGKKPIKTHKKPKKHRVRPASTA